jgi:hypothetical protein
MQHTDMASNTHTLTTHLVAQQRGTSADTSVDKQPVACNMVESQAQGLRGSHRGNATPHT